MMEFDVLLFGPQASLANEKKLTLSLDSPTARDVLKAIADTHQALRPSLPSSRLAVNHEFVDDDHTIQPGDEVALIGMVSGG